jgi:hypothetical protein
MPNDKTSSNPKRPAKKKAGGDCPSASCSAGWFIVSVVMVKDIPTGINTENKLYAIQAVSAEEAHGKAIALLAADFPEHRFHTVCSYAVDSLPNTECTNPEGCQ